MHRRRGFLFDCALPHSRRFTSISAAGFLLPYCPKNCLKSDKMGPSKRVICFVRGSSRFEMGCGRASGNQAIFVYRNNNIYTQKQSAENISVDHCWVMFSQYSCVVGFTLRSHATLSSLSTNVCSVSTCE